jgi:hypothetical protein
MLRARYLPPKLWVEALNYASHIHNKSPHRYFKDQTPFEAWSRNKSKVTHFRIFGSRAWAHVPSEKRKALDPQSTACIFVGYPDGVKGYRLLDTSTERIIIERNVQFEESPLHASLEPHTNTFVPMLTTDISDDESTHLDHGSDINSESDLEYDESMMSMHMLSHHIYPSGHKPP